MPENRPFYVVKHIFPCSKMRLFSVEALFLAVSCTFFAFFGGIFIKEKQ